MVEIVAGIEIVDKLGRWDGGIIVFRELKGFGAVEVNVTDGWAGLYDNQVRWYCRKNGNWCGTFTPK